MCELLGLCFNKEVSFLLAFSGLKAGARENPDGWGAAWYDEYGRIEGMYLSGEGEISNVGNGK